MRQCVIKQSFIQWQSVRWMLANTWRLCDTIKYNNTVLTTIVLFLAFAYIIVNISPCTTYKLSQLYISRKVLVNFDMWNDCQMRRLYDTKCLIKVFIAIENFRWRCLELIKTDIWVSELSFSSLQCPSFITINEKSELLFLYQTVRACSFKWFFWGLNGLRMTRIDKNKSVVQMTE